MEQYYSKKVMERFLKPKNLGEIKKPDGFGDTENLKCGDVMKIYLRIKKKKGEDYIEDAKFRTLGCAAAIATSDMICDLAKGKTIEKALKIGFKDVEKNLRPLPPQKLHCCILAETALRQAIENYRKKK